MHSAVAPGIMAASAAAGGRVTGQSLFQWQGADGDATFYDTLHPDFTLSPAGTGDPEVDTAITPPTGGNSLFHNSASTSAAVVADTGGADRHDFSSAPFTIEAYIYPSTSSTDNTIVAQWQVSNYVWWLGMNSLERVGFYVNNSIFLAGSTTLSASTWYHIAVCRDSSNNFALWIDGTRDISTSLGTFNSIGSAPLVLGGHGPSNAPFYPNAGRIGPVYINKGVSRYDPTSASITPDFPTGAI